MNLTESLIDERGEVRVGRIRQLPPRLPPAPLSLARPARARPPTRIHVTLMYATDDVKI